MNQDDDVQLSTSTSAQGFQTTGQCTNFTILIKSGANEAVYSFDLYGIDNIRKHSDNLDELFRLAEDSDQDHPHEVVLEEKDCSLAAQLN